MENSSTMKHWVWAMVLAVVVLVQSGCAVLAAGAVGAGATAYLKGELESSLSADIDEAHAAAEAAVDELELALISSRKDRLVAVVLARTADDKRVEITLDAVSPQLTKARIRVGVFGDETIALRMLEEMRNQL